MSNDRSPEDPKEFDAPPPPPDEPSDDEQDMGLATEMVFSGQRRQELRDETANETLNTEEVPYEDDDKNSNDDVTADDDASDEHSTELQVTEDHSELRESVQQSGHGTRSPWDSAIQANDQNFGTYEPRSFDPQHYYSQQTGTTNQPLALAMLVVLLLVAIGIFGVLGLLIYRLVTGA